MAKAVVDALRSPMTQHDGINHVSMEFGEPDPTQDLFDAGHEDGWNDGRFGGGDDLYIDDDEHMLSQGSRSQRLSAMPGVALSVELACMYLLPACTSTDDK